MRLFIPILLVLFLGGCGWVYQVGSNNSSEFDISEAQMQISEFEFINQDNEPYGSEQLEGEFWMANMIFTYCPSVCPTMTPNMQRLQSAMKEKGLNMSFISFTVDPERDTPNQLKQYGTNVGADLQSWHFLTGYSVDEIAEFSKESFKSIVQNVEDSEDIMHSTSFFLVDPEGNVIRKYDGLQSDQEAIIKDLEETINQ
ncbi:SCO family protein [Halalkalibacter kiskunsagensis]|uniref:SCO family protein n=1 Tax=Halalkalibacter kiskunsagensis TaxID=1548599 RepID=A0ABV6K7Q2_9BACI